MSIVINDQLIAYALALFIARGIIFIGIREWFQPSIAARGFGVPLVAPADRDFLAIKASHNFQVTLQVRNPALMPEYRTPIPNAIVKGLA
jgi:hypothetical protein